jgi:hypothetical protein
VVAETKVENTYIYVCESISENKIKYENVWQEGNPIEVKNGIISNKKEKYCDLLYVQNEQKQLIEWIEQMEISCKDMIDNKKKLWFQSDLTRDDIDNMMTPLYRLYKSGINVLIRTYIDVNKHNQKPKCLKAIRFLLI